MRVKTRTNFLTRTRYLINDVIKQLIVMVRKTKIKKEVINNNLDSILIFVIINACYKMLFHCYKNSFVPSETMALSQLEKLHGAQAIYA